MSSPTNTKSATTEGSKPADSPNIVRMDARAERLKANLKRRKLAAKAKKSSESQA